MENKKCFCKINYHHNNHTVEKQFLLVCSFASLSLSHSVSEKFLCARRGRGEWRRIEGLRANAGPQEEASAMDSPEIRVSITAPEELEISFETFR